VSSERRYAERSAEGPQDRYARRIAIALTATLTAFVGAAVLIQPGDGGRSPSEKPAQAQATAPQVPIARIKRRVERLRRLRFRRPLDVTFATPAQAQRLLSAATARDYSRQQQLIDEEELKLLGLLPPSIDLTKALTAVDREEVLGFYDDRSKRLVVIRGEGASRPLLEVTLAHELVHALEDQHFGLRASRGLNDDASLARDALHEGTATVVMGEYASRYLDLGGLLGVLGSLSGTSAKLPKFVEDSLLFPYDAGERFVLRIQRAGWRAVDRALRSRPPESTEQVLHPQKYRAREQPFDIGSSDLAKSLGAGWQRVDSASVGEFDLHELFAIVGKEHRAAASAGWAGGRFELWRRVALAGPDCRAPCIRRDVGMVRVQWDSNRDRAEGEVALGESFERGLSGRRLSSGSAAWSSRGGSIVMAGRARQTNVVLAPSAALAARVLLALLRR
jgi:hypothetical protein